MLAGFDPAVLALSSQPFGLSWQDGRETRWYGPDFFLLLTDGGAVVLDCRASSPAAPRGLAAAEAIRQACGEAGWDDVCAAGGCQRAAGVLVRHGFGRGAWSPPPAMEGEGGAARRRSCSSAGADHQRCDPRGGRWPLCPVGVGGGYGPGGSSSV